ncbi:MAG: hypothetical protein L7H04_05455 [Vulcanisaeta sp.]|uniref:hypothetical protein n=1 Tax=Vulcanisaeta sp. EB80 TaxID=1650660 RepID=UPI00117D9D4C|nr:hypothetical protein [Vulcanisaeta sp. EB80]MCG2865296.1 hypothetical protein [Vulcanisaeta sp.]MDT7969855.1 hypothetical protein [Vulcanisaeta sp.]
MVRLAEGLNVSRRKDPGNYYVAIMDKATYTKLSDALRRLGLLPEEAGNIVIVRDRSWSRIKRLINIARELGINVVED